MINLKNLVQIAFVGTVVVIASLFILVSNQDAKAAAAQQESLWLNNFINRMVNVTFVAKSDQPERVVECRLIEIDDTGLVFRFDSPNLVYYPYSSIYSIDP